MNTNLRKDTLTLDRVLRAGSGLVAVALVAGCANTHHIQVGSIPDDYRTNHPIVIAEKEVKIDIPVGRGDRRVTTLQKTAVEGFLANYDRREAPSVNLIVPTGSANELAARDVAGGLLRIMNRNGVPDSRITTLAYRSPSPEASPPIRISYVGVKAQTGPCGRWPEDIADTTQNKHYSNFGCAYQNNLAAQIANPSDLIGPRKSTEIDAERRGVSISDYRARESVFEPNIDY